MQRIYTIVAAILIALPMFVGPHKSYAAGATLFISPSSGSFLVGERFSVSMRLNSGGVSVNAAEGTLAFEPDQLEVVSLSRSGSVFSLWPQEPVFSNSAGSISFGGGIPSPGFSGNSGLLFTATLRVKKSGTATLRFVSGDVLANDGSGTNVLAGSNSASFSTSVSKPNPTPVPSALPPTAPPSAPVISSPTHPINFAEHPDAASWDNNDSPEFNWKSDPDANSFSYAFDHEPATVPDTLSEGSSTAKIYPNIDDGIWYFHIRAQNSGGWGAASHYEVHIDATPPESFSIDIAGGRDITNPRPEIRFSTKDVLAGIDHYKLRVDSGEQRSVAPEEAATALTLNELSPGNHALAVTAYDRAGNYRDAFAEFAIHTLEPPTITAYSRTISSNEVVFIEGKALPGTSVVVTIARPDGSEESVREISVDAEGDWTFLGMQNRAAGQWRITIRTKDVQGAISEQKAEVAMEVIPVAIRIGKYKVTYASAYGAGASVLLFGALVILLILVRFRKKLRMLHTKVLKEVTEAEYAVHAGFQTLRGDVIEELQTIDALQSIRQLTPAEQARREKMLRDLAFIEFQVTKEVEDIEHVLKHSKKEEMLPPPPPPQ